MEEAQNAEARAWIVENPLECAQELISLRNIEVIPEKSLRLDESLVYEMAAVVKLCFNVSKEEEDALGKIKSTLGEFNDSTTTTCFLYREADGQLTGLVGLTERKGGAFEHHLCVLPSHRQQGRGLDLQEALCLHAAERGIFEIVGDARGGKLFVLLIFFIPLSKAFHFKTLSLVRSHCPCPRLLQVPWLRRHARFRAFFKRRRGEVEEGYSHVSQEQGDDETTFRTRKI